MIQKYAELYGTLKIPKKFVVPSNTDVWPIEMWEHNLGRKIESVRQGRAYHEIRDDLIAMGITISTKEPTNPTRLSNVSMVVEQSTDFNNNVMIKSVVNNDINSGMIESSAVVGLSQVV